MLQIAAAVSTRNVSSPKPVIRHTVSRANARPKRTPTCVLFPLSAPGSANCSGNLFDRCHAGDLDARNQIIVSYLPLIRRIAGEFARQFGEPVDDLVQVAICGHANPGKPPRNGVLYAISKYREDRGAFSTFAKTAARWAILQHLKANRRAAAILESFASENSDDDGVSGDQPEFADDHFDVDALRPRLNAALDAIDLTDRDRCIFESYHGLNGKRSRSFQEIGSECGLSGERCRQIACAIFERLKSALQISSSQDPYSSVFHRVINKKIPGNGCDPMPGKRMDFENEGSKR